MCRASKAFRACRGTMAQTAKRAKMAHRARKAFRACPGTMAQTAKMAKMAHRARKGQSEHPEQQGHREVRFGMPQPPRFGKGGRSGGKGTGKGGGKYWRKGAFNVDADDGKDEEPEDDAHEEFDWGGEDSEGEAQEAGAEGSGGFDYDAELADAFYQGLKQRGRAKGGGKGGSKGNKKFGRHADCGQEGHWRGYRSARRSSVERARRSSRAPQLPTPAPARPARTHRRIQASRAWPWRWSCSRTRSHRTR